MTRTRLMPAPLGSVDTLGYVRVSKEEQAREGKDSLAHQRERIAAKAAALGRTIGHVFEDPGFSGGTAEGRPAFMALIAYCRQQRRALRAPGYVFVYNDSRWGRFTNSEEATYWRVELHRHGWIVRFSESDDSDDPISRPLVRAIGTITATKEREEIRARARQGGRSTAARGQWNCEAPLGYRRLAEDARGQSRVLDVGQRKADDEVVRLTLGPPEEVAFVQWLFARYASGTTSLGELVLACATRWPQEPWYTQKLHTMLKRETYLGDVVYGKRGQDPQTGQQTRAQDPSRCIVVRDAHPPIIDRATFDQVQARFTANRSTVRHPQQAYALTGVLHCVHCGHPYTGAGGPKGPADDPNRHRSYRCRGAGINYRACPVPAQMTLAVRMLDAFVVNTISEVIAAPDFRHYFEAEWDRWHSANSATSASTRKQLQDQIAGLEAERNRLVMAVGRGIFTDAEAAERMQTLRQTIDALTTQMQQGRFAGRRQQRSTAERTAILDSMQRFPDIVRTARGLQLREYLAPWIREGTVNQEHRTVTLAITPVPGMTMLRASSNPPGPNGQHTEQLIIRRTLEIPADIGLRRAQFYRIVAGGTG